MNPVVQIVGVTKRYRRGSEIVTAVDQATFELRPGTTTALVGPSGSGKTTLLDLVVGGDEPDDGTIRGVPDVPDWSRLAIVPQSLGLLDELTIGENISLPDRFGTSPSSAAADLMARLAIDHLAERSPAETSLGEQQRAAVARALLAGPALLVADEPTSHQDEANTFRVVDALAACAAGGSCVLLATHDHRVLERCDVVLAMRDGVVAPWDGPR